MENKCKYNEAENFHGFMKKFTDALKINPEDVQIEHSIYINDKGKKEHCISVVKDCNKGKTNE